MRENWQVSSFSSVPSEYTYGDFLEFGVFLATASFAFAARVLFATGFLAGFSLAALEICAYIVRLCGAIDLGEKNRLCFNHCSIGYKDKSIYCLLQEYPLLLVVKDSIDVLKT